MAMLCFVSKSFQEVARHVQHTLIFLGGRWVGTYHFAIGMQFSNFGLEFSKRFISRQKINEQIVDLIRIDFEI